jgi:protein-tyrosine kinase
MSLIEAALAKMQRRESARGNEPRTSSRRIDGRDANKAAIVAATARAFTPAVLDNEAMERNCVLPGVSDHAAMRAYKILRTRLLQRMTANQWHSLAITSPASEQGKTLTAINLAVALAQDPNTWVFLVDLDLQRPQVGNQMGMRVERGLNNYLLGTAELAEVIYDPGIPRLSVIPNLRAFEHSSELLGGPRMLELLRFLDAEVPRRVVIFDMPPLLLADDVLTFAPHVEGVLLVVAEGVTTRATVQKSKELLAEMNLMGVVLNRSSERDDTGYY